MSGPRERRNLLRELTQEAVDEGSYGEPAPDLTTTLRDQMGDALRKAFEHHIVAEWICCDPPQKGHKLCKRGHTALVMVRSLLDEDSTSHTQTSPIIDALLPVFEAEIARARASCCEDGERTYGEMERHLTQRAEEAEERAQAVIDEVLTICDSFETAPEGAPEYIYSLGRKDGLDWVRAAVERAMGRGERNSVPYVPKEHADQAEAAIVNLLRCCDFSDEQGKPELTTAYIRGQLGRDAAGLLAVHAESQRALDGEQPEADGLPVDTWTVSVEVPLRLPVEMRHALFDAVANAVGDWEPDDRDGWDAEVSGNPTADSLRVWEALAAVRRVQSLLEPAPTGSAFAINRGGVGETRVQAVVPRDDIRAALDRPEETL